MQSRRAGSLGRPVSARSGHQVDTLDGCFGPLIVDPLLAGSARVDQASTLRSIWGAALDALRTSVSDSSRFRTWLPPNPGMKHFACKASSPPSGSLTRHSTPWSDPAPLRKKVAPEGRGSSTALQNPGTGTRRGRGCVKSRPMAAWCHIQRLCLPRVDPYYNVVSISTRQRHRII